MQSLNSLVYNPQIMATGRASIRLAGAMWGSGFVALAIILGNSSDVRAQSLNEEVLRLLSDNCFALIGGATPGIFPDNVAGAGPNLNALCPDFPNTTGGATSGGAAGASLGSSGLTPERAIEERLKKVRGNDDENPTKGASADVDFAGGLGAFVSFDYARRDKNESRFAAGFESDNFGVTAGGDYTIDERLVVGAALNYNKLGGDFDNNGGDFDVQSYGVLLYGSYVPAPSFFIDVSAGYSRKNYDVNRSVSYSQAGGAQPISVSGTASGDPDGNEFTAHTLVGYDHAIGNITVGPRIGLNYSYNEIKSYSETGGTGLEIRYDDQNVTSFSSVLGAQASVAISTSFGVLVPQVNAEYIHEFQNRSHMVGVQFAEDTRPTPTRFEFQTEGADTDYVNVGVGLVAVFPNGISSFVNFRTVLANDQYDEYGGTAGLRFSF